MSIVKPGIAWFSGVAAAYAAGKLIPSLGQTQNATSVSDISTGALLATSAISAGATYVVGAMLGISKSAQLWMAGLSLVGAVVMVKLNDYAQTLQSTSGSSSS